MKACRGRGLNSSLSWVSASSAQDYTHPNSLHFREAGRASKLGFMELMAFFLPSPSLSPSLQASGPPPRGPLPGAQTSQEGSAISELLPLVGRVGRPETPPGAQPLLQARSTASLVREEGPSGRKTADSSGRLPKGGCAGPGVLVSLWVSTPPYLRQGRELRLSQILSAGGWQVAGAQGWRPVGCGGAESWPFLGPRI